MKRFFSLCTMLATTILLAGSANAQVFTNVINTKAALIIPALDGFGNMYSGGFFADSTNIGGTMYYGFGDNDPMLVKYDAAGTPLWVRYGGTANWEKFVRIKADDAGNVYGIINFQTSTNWEGSAYTASGSYDFLLVKYDGAGTLVWASQIGSTANENGNYVWMNFDNSGDLHISMAAAASSIDVAGSSIPLTGSGTRFFDIKIDPSTGNALSVHNFGSTAGSFVSTPVMYVDGNENIYLSVYSDASVTLGGSSLAAGHYQAKVNAAGTLGWSKLVTYASDRDECVAVDAAGNVTWSGDWDTHIDLIDTTQTQIGAASNDIFVVRYDNTGAYQWVKFWGGTSSDEAPSCLLTPSGDYILTGMCGNMNVDGLALTTSGGTDMYVVRLDPSGNVLSAWSTHGTASETDFNGALTAIDNSGNLVMTCGAIPTLSFGGFSFTNPLWQFFNLVISSNACDASGKVYRDFNNNGSYDAGDAGLPYAIVQTDLGGYYAMSGLSGNYHLYTTPGTYTISIPSPPLYHTLTTAATQTATFTTLGDVDTANHFGFYPTPGIRDLKVSATNVVPAKPAHIYSILLSYQNVGTDTADGTLMFGYAAGISYFYSLATPDYFGTDSVGWNFTGLLPGETRSIELFLNIPSTATEGTVLTFPMTINSAVADYAPSDNHLDYMTTVVSSLDPNYKEVTPSAVDPAYVYGGGWFDYAIHFQNTGTDTAFNIIVRDTLSADLDMATFEMIGASAPVAVSMKNPRVLEFQFSNINLPDSNVNEPASHAVVSFRIKANPSMTTPGVINNIAAIYFDYNAPVITNNAPIVVGDLGVGGASIKNNDFVLYPNPATTSLWITLRSVLTGSQLLEISDVSGRVMSTTILSAREQAISVAQLAPGMYYASLISNGKVTGIQKIVIVR